MRAVRGKTVVITGANAGIGKETARALAGMGATVVMAVRNVASGRAAAREIGGRVEVMRVDLASLADVRRFAGELKAAHPRVDALVNNAGIHTARRVLTVDGYEETFAVNHLAHFLLTNLLLDALKASAPARVVTIASDAHRGGTMDFDDLMGERRWSGLKAYTQSKLANIMFAFELARRLESSGVTSNAVHPGSVRTGWARGAESGLFRFGVALASPFLLSPAQGARTSAWAASAPELDGVTGKYLRRRRIAQPTKAAQDVAAQKRLWEISERLVGTK